MRLLGVLMAVSVLACGRLNAPDPDARKPDPDGKPMPTADGSGPVSDAGSGSGSGSGSNFDAAVAGLEPAAAAEEP